MNFQSVVEYFYQRGNEVLNMNYSLDVMRLMVAELDHPERRYPAALIAGTNGKGSVAAMIAGILRECGLRTGLYTSPHLVHITERIRINGQEISQIDFAAYGTRVIETCERLVKRGDRIVPPTYFEMVTALAFLYFAERQIEFAVLEVGLGGRLDATNIVNPECAVITSISYDHQQWLGNTLDKIAYEKAGIIKPNTIAISGCEDETARAVIKHRCADVQAPLIEVASACRFTHVENDKGRYRFDLTTPVRTYAGLTLNLSGRHQMRNAAVAALTAEALAARGFAVKQDKIGAGIGHTRWPGRIDLRQYPAPIILDGAHNVEAVMALRAFLQENYNSARIVLIFGAMRDKDIRRLGEILFPLAVRVVLTQVNNPRSAAPATIAEACASVRDDFLIAASPAEARRIAETIPHDLIVVAGSFYLVGEIYRLLQGEREM